MAAADKPVRKVAIVRGGTAAWMLLSYRKPITASSTRAGWGTASVADEDQRTFWLADKNKPGVNLTMDLGAPKTVRALQVNFADYKSGRFADAADICTDFVLQASSDGTNWQDIARTEAPRRDRPNAYFELRQPVRARFIRYVHNHVGAANLAISDIRVFGNADGPPSTQPTGVTAQRHTDDRDATIRWSRVPGAVGYNIRFGVRSNRLTLTHQLWADELGGAPMLSKELRSLNKSVNYWAAVESVQRERRFAAQSRR